MTPPQLQRALGSRTVIDQAIGITRARSGGTTEEAFDRLQNTPLHEVADRMVEEAVRCARARHQRPDPTP